MQVNLCDGHSADLDLPLRRMDEFKIAKLMLCKKKGFIVHDWRLVLSRYLSCHRKAKAVYSAICQELIYIFKRSYLNYTDRFAHHSFHPTYLTEFDIDMAYRHLPSPR